MHISAFFEGAMTSNEELGTWKPVIRRSDGPVYLAIADALSADILSGTLPEGSRLPPQRSLAQALGIDFTTVSRAYAESRRRGLVEGRVGQGTYVRVRQSAPDQAVSTGMIDMSMNLPPRFDDAGLVARMWNGVSGLEATGGLDLLLRYQEPGGTIADKAAGVMWLAPRLSALSAEQVMICPGVQGALLAIVGLLAAPGDTICVESLTYPGFRSLAAHLKIRLVPVEMDENGAIPDAFDAACQSNKPKAFYCAPTLHNPTTATMPLERRKAFVAIARKHGVPIIEDDVYGMLPRHAPTPLATLAPDLVYYVGGISKCLSPALRVAYVVPPDARSSTRLAGAIRSLTSMASPLTVAVATRWIQDGTADAIVSAIRDETAARQKIARELLPPDAFVTNPESFHVWLPIPAPWTRAEFTARLRLLGIGVVSSDAFALGHAPEAVRLGLGAASTQEELRRSLQIVADLAAEQPALSSMVV
jgi:DNA-binding transcriptional MocR family regulator